MLPSTTATLLAGTSSSQASSGALSLLFSRLPFPSLLIISVLITSLLIISILVTNVLITNVLLMPCSHICASCFSWQHWAITAVIHAVSYGGTAFAHMQFNMQFPMHHDGRIVRVCMQQMLPVYMPNAALLQELADGKLQNVRYHSSSQNLLHRPSQQLVQHSLKPEMLFGSIMLVAQTCMLRLSTPPI
jgi:hypothetical protein